MVKFTRVQGLSQYEKDQEKNRQIVQSTAQKPKASTGTTQKQPSLLEQATGGSTDSRFSLPGTQSLLSSARLSTAQSIKKGLQKPQKIQSDWADMPETDLISTISGNINSLKEQFSQSKVGKAADVVESSALKGMSSFNTQIAKTLNLPAQAISDLFGLENKFPTAWLAENREQAERVLSEDAAAKAAEFGKGGEIASNLLSTSVQAVPSAVLAVLSGGSSAVSQLAPQASGISGTIASGLQSVMSNPMTKTTFLTTVGSEYEHAKASGASTGEALVAAIGSSLVQAGIESGGGLEKLPQNLRTGDTSKWLAVLRSGAEEAIEEPAQNIVSGAINKGVYDTDRPVFSTTDETAVINPAREAESAAYAFGSGLLLGSGQNIALSALNRSRGQANTQPGQYVPEQAETPTQTQQGGNVQTVQPASVLDKAAAEFNQRGAVSNNTATAILNDPAAVAELQQNGLNLTDGMTQSQRRAAVKETMARMQGPDETFSTGAQAVLDVLNGRQDVEQAPADTTTSYQPPEAVQTVLDVLEGRTTQEQREAEYSQWGIEKEKVRQAKADISKSGFSGSDMTRYNQLIQKYGQQNVDTAIGELLDDNVLKLNGGGQYAPVDPMAHIENRDAASVSSRRQNAFQYDNPELHPYMSEAAYTLIGDVANTTRGERFPTDEYGQRWTGVKRNTTPMIAEMKDTYGMSYDQIIKGAEDIIADQGQENNANAKRVETFLDDMLVNGHQTITGENIPPNAEYIQLRNQIPGSDSFQQQAAQPGETTSVGAAPAGFEGDRVRGFSENLATDQARNEMIREDYELAPEMYQTLSNKETLSKAQAIYDKGLDAARSEVETAIGKARAGQKLAPEMVPLAKMVADDLAASGDLTAARLILDNVAVELTASGQLSQAAKILREAGPAARVNMLDQAIDQINQWGRSRYKDKWTDFSLTEEEAAQAAAIQNGDEQAFMDLYQQVARRIGKEMPATWWEKMTEIRRVSMLANPTTQIRNLFGNVPMAIENRAANRLSGLIQSGMKKAGLLDASAQTRTATVSKTSKDLSRQLFAEKGQEIMASADKWDMNSMMRQYRKYFGNSTPGKALDAVRDFTYTWMEKGDRPFFKNAFIDSAAQIMEARGIKNYEDITQEVIDFATKNAMESTFKDATVVASALNKIKQKGGAGGAALDIIIPFTTTPINITRQSVKYSPAGFIDAMYQGFKGDKSGMADALARALTGSAGWAIAAILAKMEVITGAADDDPDKRNFDIMVGDQAFSFGGKIAYDWAQPFASQLAAGAAIYEAIRDNENLMDAVTNAAKDAGDVVLDMSVLSNVQDLFSGYGSPSENIVDTLFSGIFSQSTPSIVGQLARAIDPTVRSSVTGGNSLESALTGVMAKVPGLSQQLPASVDQWGRDKTRVENPALRAFDEFLNPANLNTGKKTAVDTELLRLSDALEELKQTDDSAPGKNTVFPSVAPYDVDGVKLSGDERAQYQRTMGQAAYSFVSDLVQSEAYQNASDKDRAKQVARAYALANAMAMKEYDQSYDGGDWEKALAAIESGVEPSAWFAADAALRLTGGSSSNQADYTEALESVDGLTDDQKASMWAAQSKDWKAEKNPYTGTLAQQGLTPMEIVDIIDAHKAASDMDLSARDQAAEFSKALDSMDLTDDQYAAAMDTYGFGVYLPVDPSAYDYKTMNDTQKAVWDNWGSSQYDMDEFLELYRAMTAYDSEGNAPSKAESIEALYEKLGDRTKATRFYTQAKKKWD